MNVYESRNPIYLKSFVNRILTSFGTNPAAALLVTPEMKLIKEPGGSFTPNSLLADFEAVEADYDDYAALALTGLVLANIDGSNRAVVGTGQFAVTTNPPLVVNTVYGYWIESTAGIVAYEMFPEAERAAMAAAGDLLIINLKLPQGYFYSLPVQG